MKAILLGLLIVLSVNTAKAFVFDDLVETLRGIFESWEVNKEEVNKLIICIGDLKDIEFQIDEIMKEFKEIDFKDISKLITLIAKLFGHLQQIFKDITPCLDTKGEIKKLLDKIIHLTPIQILLKLFENVMKNGQKIYNEIMALVKAYNEKNYYSFGYNIGEILEDLFLRT